MSQVNLANAVDTIPYTQHGTFDPTVTALFGLPGYLYIRTAGTIGVYQKQDSGISTNWTLIASSTPPAASPLLAPQATTIADFTFTTQKYLIADNTAAGITTITLPTAVIAPGSIIGIKKTAGAAFTIAAAGGQTIDGAATQSVGTNVQQFLYVTDGANWFLASKS